MNNLRSTYGKHRRKQEGSLKSGSGARDVYNPKWKFFSKIDAFLRDHMKALASKSNLNVASEDEQSADETDYDDEDDHHEEVIVEAPPPTRKRKAKPTKASNTTTSPNDQLLLACADNLKKISSRSTTPTPPVSQVGEDSEDLFGKIVAKSLRKISDEQIREYTKLEIQTLLVRAQFPASQSPHTLHRGSSSSSQTPVFQSPTTPTGPRFRPPTPTDDATNNPSPFTNLLYNY